MDSSSQDEDSIRLLKAPLWRHVEILEKHGPDGGNVKWKCRYCNHIAKTSYSRVKAHLLKSSNGGIRICHKVTVPILTQLRNEVAKAEEQLVRQTKTVPLPCAAGAAAASCAESSMGSSLAGTRKRTKSSAIEKAFNMETRNQLDAMIARLFYSAGLPFNVARNPYYQSSYNFAATHNIAGYTPPGYNRLRTTLLQQERAHIEDLMERIKGTWSQKGVTICSDGWSDAQRRPLINFLAISESGPMFLQAINAEGEVKTKEYIAEKLRAVIESIGPRRVVQVITDNAANCRGAGLIIQQEYTHIFWTPCVVHTLNLALKNICAPKTPRNEEEQVIFEELSWITEIADDAVWIKNFIMNHGLRLTLFNEFSRLKLLAVAETRFASVIVMLKRFLLVKGALQSMAISEQWSILRDDNVQQAQRVKEIVLSDVWWDKVKYIVEFTEPIYEMIRVADTDSPCLHLIYEMWDTMIEKVKKVIYRHEGKEDDEESSFDSVVHDILVERWLKGNNPLHCLAHSLNPRYYSEKWLTEGEGRVPPHEDLEVSQMRMKCFKKFFPVQEDLRRVKEDYAKFSTCSVDFNDFDSIYDRGILDPVNWWVNHGQSVPVLQKLALKLCNQPASSSCCERNWSTYGFIHSMRRNKLTPERAQDLVFVHNNLRLLSRRTEAYKKGAARMWDVGGDNHDSLDGVGILEIANLSLDEPELESIAFEGVENENFAAAIDEEIDENEDQSG